MPSLTNRKRHVKAAQEWIVWRAAESRTEGEKGIEYRAASGWTRIRSEAKVFGSAADAQVYAKDAHVSRK